jgi:hypothetical protein
MSFFFSKQRTVGKTGPVWEFGTSGRGEETRRGCRRVIMMEILCTVVFKWKNETC